MKSTKTAPRTIKNLNTGDCSVELNIGREVIWLTLKQDKLKITDFVIIKYADTEKIFVEQSNKSDHGGYQYTHMWLST